MTTENKIKTAPHSKDSEMMVLGCMLTNLDNLQIAAEGLDDSDFYFTEHKTIFGILKTAYKNDKPADVHLVCEELKRLDKLKAVGGAGYITTLAQFVGTSAYLEEYVNIVKDRSVLRQLLKTAEKKISSILEDEKTSDDIISEWGNEVDNIKRENLRNSTCDILPYTLEDLQGDLSKTKEGLKTGYKELDDMVRIPNEAITLVAGRPSHGKTTFMLNLFLNMISQYPDLHFYFFSYEETRQQIAVKIINILSGWLFEESKNIIQLEGYLRTGTTSYGMVEKGKELYKKLVESGRLRIVGEPYPVQVLPSIIGSLKSKVPLGGVFIDYIQKIKNNKKFGTRQLDLADTSSIILEAAKRYSIPIILGAQLGRDKDSKDKVRLENLREAGDLEQDANLVLGLHNPSMEKALDEQKQLTSREVELKITPLKNRNGIVNKTITLIFDRPLLKIKDKK